MKKIILAASLLVAVYSCKKEEGGKNEITTEVAAETPKTNHKIVTLSGGNTEFVSSLGQEKEIDATDVTRTYPETFNTTA